MACNVSSFSVGGERELLATIGSSEPYMTISDTTLLQWKNKYRYLLITTESARSTNELFYSSFLTPSEEFYNFFVGTNVGNRTFGGYEFEIFEKGGTTASSRPNRWWTEGANGTTKIYGLTF